MPQQPELNEQTFRKLCEEACTKFPDLPRLKFIAAVGVYDAEIGGPEKDSVRLTQALDYSLKSGFLIDPDFEIDVINFREGRDFLVEEKPADLVFVSYIISGGYSYLPNFRPEAPLVDDELKLMVMVSRRNHPICWATHMEEIGAKLVITYGGNIEVNTEPFSDYEDLGYSVLIPTPEDECCGRFVAGKDIKKLYPQLPHIDLPQGWFGFAAEKEYLGKLGGAFNKATCLGAEAQRHIVINKREASPLPAQNRGIWPFMRLTKG